MKKRIVSVGLVSALCVSMILVLGGCGSQVKKYDYDLSEYIEVGEYKGLEYEQKEVTVSDEEVEDEINRILKQKATFEEVKEGVVEDGDTINVAYIGTVDGKEFDGGSTESSEITIGTTQMIDGFVEGLVGKNIGDNVILDLKFPENYHEDSLAGKDCQFDVTIKFKKVEVIPEFNDDFVKKNSDYKTTDEYKDYVKEGLLSAKQAEEEQNVKQGLWEKIVTSSKVLKYPEKEMNELTASTKEDLKATISQQGLEWEDYLKQSGTTEEEFNETVEAYVKERVMQDMVVYSIANAEEISVSDKEYDEFMDDLLENAGFTESTFKDNFGMTIEEYCEGRDLRTSMLRNKIMDKVIEYGKTK